MKKTYEPDWRPEKRTKDSKTMSDMHMEKRSRCEITGNWPASIHHVLPRSQGGDDVPENLVMLEGDGVSGLHGRIENGDPEARRILGAYLQTDRSEVIFYIRQKLGEEAGADWLRRKLFIM